MTQRLKKFWLVRSKYREELSRVVSVFETKNYTVKILDVINKNEVLYIIKDKNPSSLKLDYIRGLGMSVYVLSTGNIMELANDIERAKELEQILPEIDIEAVKIADKVRADLSVKI